MDKRRNKKGKWEYLIRWKGYGSKEDTWEPEHHLLHCEEFIDQFNSLRVHSHKSKVPKKESIIASHPSAADSSRAQFESRKKKRTFDPAVGVKAGDVLGVGSGRAGSTQKQKKVGVGPGKHDSGISTALTYMPSSHGGPHFAAPVSVPHNGLQNGEMETLVYRTAARSHQPPMDRVDGELAVMDSTGQQFARERGKMLRN